MQMMRAKKKKKTFWHLGNAKKKKTLTFRNSILCLVVKVHGQHQQVSYDVVNCCICLDDREKITC